MKSIKMALSIILLTILSIVIKSSIMPLAASEPSVKSTVRSGGNIVLAGKMGIFASDFIYLEDELHRLLRETVY
ncbi:MAG: hypothetical protein LBV33_04905 [Lachnospiraceae bacterium]|jgi:hypothetical protein|nr:hypothetical protein [Lachnospiraceae bacterium]